MRRTLRVAMTVLVALLAGGTASAATAAVPAADPCATSVDGYAPAGACQLLIAQAQPTCAADVPVLDYALTEEGTSATTATITWVNSTGGADVVLTDQPLSGQLLWPGVTVVDGAAQGWPGWVQDAQGSWSEGGDYAWARGAVQVRFEVNPSVATTVVYPSSTQCAGPEFDSFVLAAPDDPTSSAVLATKDVSSSTPQAATGFMSGVLAATGADGAGSLLAVAGVLVLGGVVLLVLRRRRQQV